MDSLEVREKPSLKNKAHATECKCIDCAVTYMLLPQAHDFEEPCQPQLLSNHPRDCTCLDCMDSAVMYMLLPQAIDFDSIVPGQHSPYSPPTSVYTTFKFHNVDFPKLMYGIDTPLSPQKSP